MLKRVAKKKKISIFMDFWAEKFESSIKSKHEIEQSLRLLNWIFHLRVKLNAFKEKF